MGQVMLDAAAPAASYPQNRAAHRPVAEYRQKPFDARTVDRNFVVPERPNMLDR